MIPIQALLLQLLNPDPGVRGDTQHVLSNSEFFWGEELRVQESRSLSQLTRNSLSSSYPSDWARLRGALPMPNELALEVVMRTRKICAMHGLGREKGQGYPTAIMVCPAARDDRGDVASSTGMRDKDVVSYLRRLLDLIRNPADGPEGTLKQLAVAFPDGACVQLMCYNCHTYQRSRCWPAFVHPEDLTDIVPEV